MNAAGTAPMALRVPVDMAPSARATAPGGNTASSSIRSSEALASPRTYPRGRLEECAPRITHDKNLAKQGTIPRSSGRGLGSRKMASSSGVALNPGAMELRPTTCLSRPERYSARAALRRLTKPGSVVRHHVRGGRAGRRASALAAAVSAARRIVAFRFELPWASTSAASRPTSPYGRVSMARMPASSLANSLYRLHTAKCIVSATAMCAAPVACTEGSADTARGARRAEPRSPPAAAADPARGRAASEAGRVLAPVRSSRAC
mmetsp:Transcript_1044/g.4012  ORF Transcript_1044/g.4012 Transcript_1044/m.4012 type:complete len:263 (+) Transcript_1044:1654-2442(+)